MATEIKTAEEKKKVGVGVGVLILRDGKVLLGKRHTNPAKATSRLNGAGTWTMPGGKLEFGELLIDCAKRETQEETGMRIDAADVLCINEDIVETAHFITIGLIATKFAGEPQVMEPDKITEWHWFDLDNLPIPMYFPSEKIIKNYSQKKFFIPQ